MRETFNMKNLERVWREAEDTEFEHGDVWIHIDQNNASITDGNKGSTSVILKCYIHYSGNIQKIDDFVFADQAEVVGLGPHYIHVVATYSIFKADMQSFTMYIDNKSAVQQRKDVDKWLFNDEAINANPPPRRKKRPYQGAKTVNTNIKRQKMNANSSSTNVNEPCKE